MESKAAFKDRLQREGRWETFVARREGLKAEGKKSNEAWEMAKNEFQSQENFPASNEKGKVTCPDRTGNDSANSDFSSSGKSRKKRGSITKDFEWVYWNIGDDAIRPEDAPSASAWWMLQKVRSNPTIQIEFIRTLLQRLRPDKNESENERFNDDGRTQINLIDRVRLASQNSVLPPGA